MHTYIYIHTSMHACMHACMDSSIVTSRGTSSLEGILEGLPFCFGTASIFGVLLERSALRPKMVSDDFAGPAIVLWFRILPTLQLASFLDLPCIVVHNHGLYISLCKWMAPTWPYTTSNLSQQISSSSSPQGTCHRWRNLCRLEAINCDGVSNPQEEQYTIMVSLHG